MAFLLSYDFLQTANGVLQILPPLKRISSSRFKKNEGKDGKNLCEALLLFPKLLQLLHGDSIALYTSLSPCNLSQSVKNLDRMLRVSQIIMNIEFLHW
jgi:hypothetical protein